MTTGFFEQLAERVAATGSLLCVGLDPRVDTPRRAVEHCRALVAATASQVAAFKPNIAFFEAMGSAGVEALVEVIAGVPDEIPVLLDAKRGDISSTATAYATAAFDRLGADAVTVSPYLGRDSIEPFLEHEGRGVFVLCRTSNSGGREIQEAVLESGEPLYLAVARMATGWAGPTRLGLVIGATVPDAIARVRGVAPDHWILAPGVGAQGGELEATVAGGVREDGAGLLLPVSRAIAAAADPAAAVADLNAAVAQVDRAIDHVGAVPEADLAIELFDAGCVRFGDFELRSGAHSPIYLDLRMLAGHPRLLRRIAAHYMPLLGSEVPPSDRLRRSTPPQGTPPQGGSDLPDRIAGVPLSGLPIATAVSLASGLPMVYARPAAKEHGTRSSVEGPNDPGDRVVVVDDVATSGSSILEAAARLRESGLLVDGAVVLIDRGAGAVMSLAAARITLRSVLRLSEVVGWLLAAGRLSDSEAARVYEFLAVEDV